MEATAIHVSAPPVSATNAQPVHGLDARGDHNSRDDCQERGTPAKKLLHFIFALRAVLAWARINGHMSPTETYYPTARQPQ